MKRLVPLVALLLPLSLRADDGAVVWEPARILDAEQIAESGVFVPLPQPTVFSDFRYPFLQEDGSVVFIANDDGDARGWHGIYRISMRGEVGKLAEAGDCFANDSARLTSFSGLRVAGGRAVFRCGLDDGSTGIGMWEDGALVLLARSGDATGFENIGYPGLSDQAVTFLAHRPAEVGELYAVDLGAFPRIPRKVVDTWTPVPDNEGKFFGSFGFQQDADGDSAVFRGFDVGARELLQETGGERSASGGVYRKNIRTAGPPVKIIDTTTPLPGAAGGGTFAELQNAIPRDGTVVIPSWSRERSGIYFVGRNGKPLLVADTTTKIPDLFDGPFTGFNKWAANCAPWVIFRGYADGNYEGLFAMHMERNELFLLIDTNTDLGGKKVAGFELSCAPKLGEDLVLAIDFAGGKSGLYQLKFGDGWGQAVFRKENGEQDKADRASDGLSDLVPPADAEKTEPSAGAIGPDVTAQMVEAGIFRMVGEGEAYGAPGAATGKANEFDEAELLQRSDTFPARQGLNFGYRYVLRSTDEGLCHDDGFDMLITHPPITGPDGVARTSSLIPMDVCFRDGKAEDFLIYGLEEEHEVLPGRWTLQVRKDGRVLISRSFTLL